MKIGDTESVPYLTSIWNEELVNKCNFPNNLKLADVTPVFKKNSATTASNYRPVSVLPTVSKIFERLMHKQISGFINESLSPYLCGYRSAFNTQNALLCPFV